MTLVSDFNATQRIDLVQPSKKNKDKVTGKRFYKDSPSLPNWLNSTLAPGLDSTEFVIPHLTQEVIVKHKRIYETIKIVNRETIYQHIFFDKKSKLNWLENNLSDATNKEKDMFKFFG